MTELVWRHDVQESLKRIEKLTLDDDGDDYYSEDYEDDDDGEGQAPGQMSKEAAEEKGVAPDW